MEILAPASWVARSLCLLVLLMTAAPAQATPGAARYVLSGEPAPAEGEQRPCSEDPHRHRTRLRLPAPAQGWSGAPQAVVVMNLFAGQVTIGHGERVRCAWLQDAQTLDSRFQSGMGTVLVPGKGDTRPIEIEFDPSPFPWWRPLVRLGAPDRVQREDTARFGLRVGASAVLFALVLSALLTYVSTREYAFLRYALIMLGYVLWLTLLSGLWAHLWQWMPGDYGLWLLAALPAALAGATTRMLFRHNDLDYGARWLEVLSRGVACMGVVTAAGVLLLPRHALERASLVIEAIAYALGALVAAAAMLALARGHLRAVAALVSVAPFLAMAVGEWLAPEQLVLWKVELMMVATCCLALTSSLVLTLRLGSLRRQRDELRVLAQTDALTGLPNRRAALDHLGTAVAQARSQRQPLTVVFLDLDHFKDINDQHGHAVGDRVLAQVAHTLRWTFRDTAYVARMGGEEFLIVLPGVQQAEAAQRIEHLRQRLREVGPLLELDELQISASAGVAALAHPDEPVPSLLQRADAAMYAAKRNGRDRVELAPPPGATATAGNAAA